MVVGWIDNWAHSLLAKERWAYRCRAFLIPQQFAMLIAPLLDGVVINQARLSGGAGEGIN